MPNDSVAPGPQVPSVAIVVLTMGTRADEITALAASVASANVFEKHVVLNGCSDSEISLAGWAVTKLPENVGVPAGRSVGVAHTTADIVVFLDDDCVVVDAGLIDRVVARFASSSKLGALGFRIRVLGGSHSLDRWIPASTSPDPTGLRQSVTFPGGGHALRRSALLGVGGYCDELFFKHEETELAWRLLDGGWDVAFDERCIVEHPETSEARHPHALRIGLRNRIWMARMLLPRPLVSLAIAFALGRHLVAVRRTHDIQQLVQGASQGFSCLPRARRPMSWSTVALLTRRGRPPVL